MATQVQWRGGSTAEHSTFTGAAREVTVDTQKKTLVVHDGSTAGGEPLLREDGSNSALDLGSAATPALKFTGDTNTGIYSPGADQVAISTNGNERLRIDNSGRLLVGTSTARENLFNSTITAAHQVETLGGGTVECLAIRNVNDTTGADFVLAKSRGTTKGSNTIVQSGDRMGTIVFMGNDGTEFVPGVRINAEVDGTPGANDMPGRLVFYTTADGASSPTERMQINSSGRLLVGTSSAFDNTQALTTFITPKFQVNGEGTEGSFLLRRADGATYLNLANGSSVSNNSAIGNINFQAYDGTNHISGARIQAVVDGNPGADDMPGRLVFSTTADGASSPTERMVIKSDGQVGIGTTSPVSDAKLTLVDSPNDNPAIAFQRVGTNREDGAIQFTAGSFVFKNGADSSTVAGLSERVRIDADGRLLVGTSSNNGGALLQVNGSFESSYHKQRGFGLNLGTANELVIAISMGDDFDSATMMFSANFGSTSETARRGFTVPVIIGYAQTPTVGTTLVSQGYTVGTSGFSVVRKSGSTWEFIIKHQGSYAYSTAYCRFTMQSTSSFSITSVTQRTKT